MVQSGSEVSWLIQCPWPASKKAGQGKASAGGLELQASTTLGIRAGGSPSSYGASAIDARALGAAAAGSMMRGLVAGSCPKSDA